MSEPSDLGPPMLRPSPLADEAMLQLIYNDLRDLAGAMLRSQRAGHTLQPTALVNEAFVRLLSRTSLRASDRVSFMALAGTVMRRILVDHARARGALKRGGESGAMALVALNEENTPAPDSTLDVLALDQALCGLAKLDERKARLVEMRVFAGMSLDEAADALTIARSTAALDWRFARAWLISALGEEERA